MRKPKSSKTITFEPEQFEYYQKRLSDDSKLNGKLSEAIHEDSVIAQNYRQIIKEIESDSASKIWTKDALRALLTFADFNTVTRDLSHHDICVIGSLMLQLAKENNIYLTENISGFPSYNDGTRIKRESVFGTEFTLKFEDSIKKYVRQVVLEEMDKFNLYFDTEKKIIKNNNK